LRYATFTAILATIAYNYFFLPPLFRFTIADPQNWIALLAFLVTAVVASQLSERARRSAVSAEGRRREFERLHELSQQLWLTENAFELLNLIPKSIVDAFGVSGAAIFVEGKQNAYFYDGASRHLFSLDQLKAISDRGEPVLDREHRICYVPLRMGVRSVGSLAVSVAISRAKASKLSAVWLASPSSAPILSRSSQKPRLPAKATGFARYCSIPLPTSFGRP
jgi:two-component system sensor histidine kinase KdpD